MSLIKYPYVAEKGSVNKYELMGQSMDQVKAELVKAVAGRGVAVAWLPNRILWGRYAEGQIAFADGSDLEGLELLELRVFNEAAECYVRKGCQGFNLRVLQDGVAGEAMEHVDSLARLWGERGDSDGSFVTLLDKARKISMQVPVEDDRFQYYGLLTRNYIGYTKNQQASYVDSRYVAIMSGEVE